MTVDIVILNFNTQNLLEELLPRVLKNSEFPGAKVVIADNASTDGSVQWVKEHYPTLELISLEKNHGYAGGYNEALKNRTADFFILLNSDAEPHEGWLKPLMEFVEKHPDLGAAQPKLIDYNKRDKFEYAGASGGFLDHFGYPFCRGRIFGNVEKDLGQYNDAREIFWATGAAFLIRREAWEKAGGLDERFFAHMEEIDLCWRLQLMGYKNYVVPESIVYHIGGGTLSNLSPRKTFFNFRNSLLMLYKNLPADERDKAVYQRKLFDGLAAVFFLLQGKFSHIRQIFKAHKEFEKLKSGMPLLHDARRLEDMPTVMNHSLVFSYFLRSQKIFSRLKF